MTPDEVTHKERRSAPEPLVLPLPLPPSRPQEPTPADRPMDEFRPDRGIPLLGAGARHAGAQEHGDAVRLARRRGRRGDLHVLAARAAAAPGAGRRVPLRPPRAHHARGLRRGVPVLPGARLLGVSQRADERADGDGRGAALGHHAARQTGHPRPVRPGALPHREARPVGAAQRQQRSLAGVARERRPPPEDDRAICSAYGVPMVPFASAARYAPSSASSLDRRQSSRPDLFDLDSFPQPATH